jgi:hypothetical protein
LKKFHKFTRDLGRVKEIFHEELAAEGIESELEMAMDAARV